MCPYSISLYSGTCVSNILWRYYYTCYKYTNEIPEILPELRVHPFLKYNLNFRFIHLVHFSLSAWKVVFCYCGNIEYVDFFLLINIWRDEITRMQIYNREIFFVCSVMIWSKLLHSYSLYSFTFLFLNKLICCSFSSLLSCSSSLPSPVPTPQSTPLFLFRKIQWV